MLSSTTTPIILTGSFSLLSALVGAAAGSLSTYIQIKKHIQQQRDDRVFNARKDAYTAALTLFASAMLERFNNHHILGSTKEESERINIIMGQTRLFASDELFSAIQKLIKCFGSDIPTNREDIHRDRKQIWKHWSKIQKMMRSELGITITV